MHLQEGGTGTTQVRNTRLYNRWIKDIIHSRDYYTQHMHIIKLITTVYTGLSRVTCHTKPAVISNF